MLKTNAYSLLFSLIILITACGGERFISKKKISNSNPTYLNINSEHNAEFIKWQDDAYENIYYTDDKTKRTDYPLQVKLGELKPKKILKSKTAPLFSLDTSSYNTSGYLSYTENPKYFGTLTSVDAHFNLKEQKIIGTYKQELLELGLSYRNIAHLLMQFGVIGTYDHLYAEKIISNKENTPDFYQINYHCVYHICTSDCYHPKYKFSIRFDKKTREISIMP